MNKGYAYAIGIIIVIIIAVVAYKALAPSVSVPHVISVTPSAANNTVMVQLTDPPAVPNGTQSLVLYYSNIELHSAGKSNSTGFMSLNALGSVNLMNLTNFTQTIGIGKINKTANFDLLKLNISGATITIDNITYNVSVPNNVLLVKLSSLLNASSSTAIVDFYPSVLQIYVANQTLFVLVPSLKGVVIKGLPLNASQAHMGAKARLQNSARAEIARYGANISIMGSTLEVHNSTVDFSVTVKDNSNSSVMVNDIMLSGYMRRIGPIAMPIIRNMQTNAMSVSGGFGRGLATGNASASYNGMYNSSMGSFPFGSLGSILSGLNLSGLNLNSLNLSNLNISNISSIASKVKNMLSQHGINISSPALSQLSDVLGNRMNASVLEDMRDLNISNSTVQGVLHQVKNFSMDYHNVLNFIVMRNGTLSLPFSIGEFDGNPISNGPNGYNLSAGASETFTYKGIIGIGNSQLRILPLVNQTYAVRAMGEDGASASANVTTS